MKKLIAFLMLLATVLALVSCSITGNSKDDDDDDDSTSSRYTCGHSSCKANGPFYCMGKNDTCRNQTYCAYVLYCESCEEEANAEPSLEKIANKYSGEWISINSSKTLLILATNPNETGNPVLYHDEVEAAFTDLAEEFDLPSTVWERIRQTRAIDGMQTYSNTALGITWFWGYDDDGYQSCLWISIEMK